LRRHLIFRPISAFRGTCPPAPLRGAAPPPARHLQTQRAPAVGDSSLSVLLLLVLLLILLLILLLLARATVRPNPGREWAMPVASRARLSDPLCWRAAGLLAARQRQQGRGP
ncbi:unnamed protein product, partial [Prorocentrum cordatum]